MFLTTQANCVLLTGYHNRQHQKTRLNQLWLDHRNHIWNLLASKGTSNSHHAKTSAKKQGLTPRQAQFVPGAKEPEAPLLASCSWPSLPSFPLSGDAHFPPFQKVPLEHKLPFSILWPLNKSLSHWHQTQVSLQASQTCALSPLETPPGALQFSMGPRKRTLKSSV